MFVVSDKGAIELSADWHKSMNVFFFVLTFERKASMNIDSSTGEERLMAAYDGGALEFCADWQWFIDVFLPFSCLHQWPWQGWTAANAENAQWLPPTVEQGNFVLLDGRV